MITTSFLIGSSVTGIVPLEVTGSGLRGEADELVLFCSAITKSHKYVRVYSIFEFHLGHSNLSTTLSTDHKLTLACFHIYSYQNYRGIRQKLSTILEDKVFQKFDSSRNIDSQSLRKRS